MEARWIYVYENTRAMFLLSMPAIRATLTGRRPLYIYGLQRVNQKSSRKQAHVAADIVSRAHP